VTKIVTLCHEIGQPTKYSHPDACQYFPEALSFKQKETQLIDYSDFELSLDPEKSSSSS